MPCIQHQSSKIRKKKEPTLVLHGNVKRQLKISMVDLLEISLLSLLLVTVVIEAAAALVVLGEGERKRGRQLKLSREDLLELV